MFFFESIPWYSLLMWIAIVAALMLLNEVSRKSKYVAIFSFLILPLVLPFVVWNKTAVPGTSVGTWFHWAKVYSALAGCLIFMGMRYSNKLRKSKAFLAFPALILAINIIEAVARDFQCFGFDGTVLVDGMYILGGPWNIMNGIAGILNIITISGFIGITVSKDKTKMLWSDQLWFWIIAYDLWNFAYVYNCVPDHSFYAGLALLIAPTICAFTLGKGAWLQHRAHTLAFWMMFVMTFPAFVDTSMFAVKSSGNSTALFIVSFVSLAANIAVFVYHFYKIFKFKRNPLTTEVHTDLEAFKEIKQESCVETV